MGYLIDASLREGCYRLRLVDEASGRIAVDWTCPAGAAVPGEGIPPEVLQSLFHQLFKASCIHRLPGALSVSELQDLCLHCGGCHPGSAPTD